MQYFIRRILTLESLKQDQYRWSTRPHSIRRATRGGEGLGDLSCPKSEFQNLCPDFRTACAKRGSFLYPKCFNRVLTFFFFFLYIVAVDFELKFFHWSSFFWLFSFFSNKLRMIACVVIFLKLNFLMKEHFT